MKPTEVRKNVYHFYEENHEKGKEFTANHFLAKGVGRSTIYGIISRYDKGIGFTRRVRKCVAPKMPPKRVKRLKAYFNYKDGVSQRKAAKKFGISQPYVNKLLKSAQHGGMVKCRKKIEIPDRSESQISKAKTKCRILTEKYAKHDWILDDESYFTLDHSSIVGNDNFYTSNFKETPASIKFKKKGKFAYMLKNKLVSRYFKYDVFRSELDGPTKISFFMEFGL